jgi:dTDP-4-dehydrorhamnose 3,5-epimerase-like enzyme
MFGPEPQLIQRQLFVDDRGYVYGAFDKMHEAGIKRTYVVENHDRNFVRAWHGHKKAATFMHVIQGAAKLVATPIDGGKPTVVHASARSPAIFYVPPGYYNGSMTLEDNTKILVYSTITLEECHGDDFRKSPHELHPDLWIIKWR